MKIFNKKEYILDDKFKYNGDLKSLTKLKELRYFIIINAISTTKNTREAASKLGISIISLSEFYKKHKISSEIRIQMRKYFNELI